VRTHLPVLAERFVRDRLRALAQAEGLMVKEVPEVLFVCVHNAGRSQMAAALLNHHAEGRVHVRSAGSTPADEIHPNVRTAMAEVGVDLSREFPKPLTDEVVRAADVVITMGCGDACPVYPGKRYLDWNLEDPAEGDLDRVRRIRDEIDRRVESSSPNSLRSRARVRSSEPPRKESNRRSPKTPAVPPLVYTRASRTGAFGEKKNRRSGHIFLERTTGFEPATPTLAKWVQGSPPTCVGATKPPLSRCLVTHRLSSFLGVSVL
jgi:protein-tyrosine-phosphatase